MKVKLRHRLGAGALLLLVAAVWWAGGERGRLHDAQAARVASEAASAPMGSAVSARALVRPASAASAVPGLEARNTESLEGLDRAGLKQRMKADWCGFGVAEFNRQRQAAYDRAKANRSGTQAGAADEAEGTPGAEVLAEAQAEVRRRWVQALAQRGDPRSRAVAELLGGADGDDAKSSARLQALARTSSDPMVTAMALQRPCEPHACANIEMSQWSRLEPANLLSWLALLRDPGAGEPRRDQADYVLERAASEARYSRTYARELFEVLSSLQEAGRGGLAVDAELKLYGHVLAGQMFDHVGTVRTLCRETPPMDVTTVQRCTAVLEALWSGDTTLERLFALVTAKGMFPAQPALRARWDPRLREYEAVTEWRREQMSSPKGAHCERTIEMRKTVRQAAEHGEWGQVRAEMQAAGADDAALSARWRRGADPVASSPPASSVR
ncbi:hypothetical protein [Roseateles asaccharophilus]|uniref:Secreted protein n=1 Tax=Roseateles asaccharophilus TaxID=582607 RepID=A0ABU2A597_9BURK|nr:hypothetical protein [Roseateles asaccharophilus]MDR7331677.1 hypothetical protein [Roseateles asaccharophilus]